MTFGHMSNTDLKFVPPYWPIESDWTVHFRDCFSRPEFQELLEFIAQRRMATSVFPSEADVFNAFRYSSFADTRVVILGQDPYHGAGQAHGLAFSVPKNTQQPPSLRNIFKELLNDLGQNGTTIPGIQTSGDLTSWAKQGVLLLNAGLTVEASHANSHQNRGWELFTDRVIRLVGQRTQRSVFILWGKSAASKKKFILAHHVVIQSAHPSPLSAFRGFFGSRPFSAANNALVEFGQDPIDWLSVFRSGK